MNKPLSSEEIKNHWTNWAHVYKDDLKATTKTPTIKMLEVDALGRAIESINFSNESDVQVLEVGCGNGFNCFPLAQKFSTYTFTGVDYIEEMVANAKASQAANASSKNLTFYQGNILELEKHSGLDLTYDVIFTDRCLINLNTPELQEAALDQLWKKLKPTGHLILIENIQHTHSQQNDLRESLGLGRRIPDSFNLFIDEARLLDYAASKLELLKQEDFACLHDVVLYVLVPALNEGRVDYDHPMVSKVTEMLLANPELAQSFNNYGQNRLYLFRNKNKKT